MLEWKCCFRTRVVRRLNDSSTVIVCLCILFLRDHLESLVLMWLCLKEIPNDSFAGLTNRSSLQRSQSGWWWHSWGVWLFAVLCSYMRLSYWRRRFSTVDLQHNDHRALHSLDFYMIFCNDVLFSFLNLYPDYCIVWVFSSFFPCIKYLVEFLVINHEHLTLHERLYLGQFWFLYGVILSVFKIDFNFFSYLLRFLHWTLLVICILFFYKWHYLLYSFFYSLCFSKEPHIGITASEIVRCLHLWLN